ncbi:hypothetical protein D3C77_691700 [compost metagenome]
MPASVTLGLTSQKRVLVLRYCSTSLFISTVAITPLELPSSSSLSALTLPTGMPLYMTSVLLA